MDNFSARLRHLRTKAGLSISELASIAKLPRQTIHRLERGERQPTLDTAHRLAKALRVSLSAFD